MLSTKPIPIIKLTSNQTSSETKEQKGNKGSSALMSHEGQRLIDNTQELNLQAQANLKSAIEEAQRLTQEAESRAEKLRDESKQLGYNDGFQEGLNCGLEEGLKQGRSEFLQQSEEMLNRMREEWFEMNQSIQKQLADLTPELTQLMIQSIEVLTYQALEDSEMKIKPMLEQILMTLGNRQRVFIQVSEKMRAEVQSALDMWKELCPNAYIQVVVDPKLKVFDCVVETEIETIDLSLDQQLTVLKEALMRVVMG